MTSYYRNRSIYTGTASVPILKHKILFLLLAAGMMIVCSSCNERPTEIGSGLLPGGDFVNMESDTSIDVESYTVYVDSVYSANKAFSFLGGIYDPYFGSTYSDFVSQLRLTKKWSGGAPIVDSVKLFVPVRGVRGNFDTQMKISIYELAEQLYADTLYYSNRTPVTGNLIGTFNVPKIAKDTARMFTFSLPVSFGEYMLRDTTKLNQEGGAGDFRSFFKGIYVSAENALKGSANGSVPDIPLIMTLEFSSGDFRIKVYYHTSTIKNLSYDFIINANSVRYNRYRHDFSAADPAKKIQHINDGYLDTISCMQGFYGMFTRIKIPELKKIKDQMPVSVNKMRLVFSVFLDNELYKTTTMPSRIYMSYVTSEGRRSIVPDFNVSSSFFDGTFSTSSKKFSFNLAAFAQEYLEGRIPSPELDMYFPDGEIKNAIMLGRGSSSPVKFEFVYTRF